MIRRDRRHGTGRRSGIGILLLTLLVLLGAGSAANAQATSCSAIGGVLDGNVTPNPPWSSIEIDQNCTFRNYPQSNPLDINFNFFTNPGGVAGSYLVIFDNVHHVGQMSCNSNDVQNHHIWLTNGAITNIKPNCQALLIPVEKIDKAVPAGQTTAAIGVPFTYTLTIPVLFDPASGGVIKSDGSVNTLHGITITDDLNATGADLTYVSHVAYWEDTGVAVPHTFSNVGGFLTFDNFPVVPADDQIVLELTVVLEDTPANTPGTVFVNTAKWDFGRLIDDVFYEPLPGEWGISEPLTIAAPELIVTKTGPATLGLTLNLGQWGTFTVDVLNTGLTDAFDVTLVDRLPDDPNGGVLNGGMCDLTPEILSARVFELDGTTPAGPPLAPGMDFSVSYVGSPTCELTLTMLTPDAVIGPNERLILTYRTQLDADTDDGASLTNVVGATQWFNGDSSNPDRVAFDRTLTNGTPGFADHQDEHTISSLIFGFFFEKTASDPVSGATISAAQPGDTLRYTLRLQATDVPLTDVSILDDLGARNDPLVVFVPGSLNVLSIPPGATDQSLPMGGTNSAGVLDVRGIDVPANSEVEIVFDIVLDGAIPDGTIVSNQAELLSPAPIAESDDPNVNGQSDPSDPNDQDPTDVLVTLAPVGPLDKAITQPTASIGETFSYQITIPATPYPFPIYDVEIFDDLGDSAADLRFQSVTKIFGSEPWTPTNLGDDTVLQIVDTNVGIDIPANEQIVLEIAVVLEDTQNNGTPLPFDNTATFTFNGQDGDDTSQRDGDPDTSEAMTVVEPELTLTKSGPATMVVGTPDNFTLDVQNAGDGPAWQATITDLLPSTPDGGVGLGGTCDTAPTIIAAQVFQSDGTTAVSPALVQGSDYTVDFTACLLTLTFTSDQTRIGPSERLIIIYEAQLDADTQDGVSLTNVAGAIEWFSFDDTSPDRRTYSEVVTDGTINTLDHQDAHTLDAARPTVLFEKVAANATTNVDPTTTAVPGDVLRYTIRVVNVSGVPIDDFDVMDDLGSRNGFPVFVPGSLVLVSAPVGADIAATDPMGGTGSMGLVDVRRLDLPAANDIAEIVFEVTLAAVIPDGTIAANQSQMLLADVPFDVSDDPNVVGDDDETEVVIQSTSAFRVEKVSDDLTGNPAILLPGETLQYTITVANIGSDEANGVTIRDAIPAGTSYVPDSTTLNGSPVPDVGGTSPLVAGISIHAPADPTPGLLPADPTLSDPDNVATIVFQVTVDPGVADGTILSNQAFVTSLPDGIVDHPSDDPDTPIPDDPTRDVVGSNPLLFASKDAVLLDDGTIPGQVDPGDSLQYTITVHNSGSVPATGVQLQDPLPANTAYRDDSTFLNGDPVGQPDGGTSPLIAGIPISSSNLTPPLPGPGGGTLSPGGTAVVTFVLEVPQNTPNGTLIVNQALVTSNDAPDLPTDGDGDPSTGPEPTVVVVGDAQQLSITKQVSVVGGGPVLAGSTLEYVVTVTNVATVDALQVIITDDLDDPDVGHLAYVPGSATLDGIAADASFAGTTITADYGLANGPLASGDSTVLRFQAVVDPGLAIGTTVTNVAEVSWNNASQMVTASVSVDVGGMLGVGALGGVAWHDVDFDDVQDAGETLLSGWEVELLLNGVVVSTATTDASGAYSIGGLVPNDVSGDSYELRFSAPGAVATTASLGMASSPFTNGPQEIQDIVLSSGSNLVDLHLPIDPNGVVYDALLRLPLPGVALQLLAAGSGNPLPATCFDDPAQQGQVTGLDGFYKFDLNFNDAACPDPGGYLIAMAPPGSGFSVGNSTLIPPQTDGSTVAFDVPACPGSAADAVFATASHCEVQISELAPPQSAPAGSPETDHHLHLLLDDSQSPGSSQLFHNHLPVDPVLNGAIAISKTTPRLNVSRGQLVPYEITVTNALGGPIDDMGIVDRFPAGFRYVEGSARIDGVPREPVVNGFELVWDNVGIAADSSRTLVLLLAVGAGVTDGEYVNRAQAVSGASASGFALSGEAAATVRVVPDPTFDCTDVMGKVFDDANRNERQDEGERGLQGVRLVTARGLVATTDAYGRYHITCAVVPNDFRGSNFVLKLDDRSLPSGYRISGRQTQVKRATRGKALRFNYGASIHRVVSLDIADPVFEPGGVSIRPQWEPRLGLLLEALREAPAILRLSYVADVEDADLVEERLEAVGQRIADAWKSDGDAYPLTIEPEVFWRRGAPPEWPGARAAEAR